MFIFIHHHSIMFIDIIVLFLFLFIIVHSLHSFISDNDNDNDDDNYGVLFFFWVVGVVVKIAKWFIIGIDTSTETNNIALEVKDDVVNAFFTYTI